MARVAAQGDGKVKVLPLLSMSNEEVDKYMLDHNLPKHPLMAKGYVSVGDWHSSRPIKEGEDPRATRFGGKFSECGLHVEGDHGMAGDALKNVVKVDTNVRLNLSANHGVVTGKVKSVLNIMDDTPIHSDTGFATHLVKKRMEDGSWCKKCTDVASMLDTDGTSEWVGGMSIADITDVESDGIRLAQHFQEEKAPFFVVRSEADAEWRVIYSYGAWKSTLKKAAKARPGETR